MLRLWLLGSTRLEEDGRSLEQVLTRPKRLALLAYLAVSPDYQRRDTLLALFWPELDTPRSRDALNQALRFLRRELGESPGSVIVSRGHGELGIERASLWCDAAAFREAMDGKRYAEAFSLYRGDLLAGFHVGAVDGFEAWLELERTRYRDAAARAALEVADAREESGDVNGAIAAARRAADLAGLDERVVRGLVARLARLGDRAGALQTFELFAHRLTRELEVEPAAETRALIEEIRRRQPPARISDREMGELALRASRVRDDHVDEPAEIHISDRRADRPAAGANRRKWRIVSAAAVGLTAIATGLAAWGSSSSPLPAWFTVDSPAGMNLRTEVTGFPFALSRDGRSVAFVANPDRQLVVLLPGRSSPVAFPKARPVGDLHFSPDGRQIAFRSGGDSGGPSVIRIDAEPAETGPTRLAATRGWTGISWTWSDEVVYTWANALWRASPSGGKPVMIARMDSTAYSRWRQPTVLSDGKTIALRVTPRGVTSPASDRIALLSINGGPLTLLDFVADGALGYFDGALIYSRLAEEWDRGQIMAVKFDLKRRRPLGAPILLQDSVDMHSDLGALAAISANGTLAYLTTTPSAIMQIMDAGGAVLDEVDGLRWYRQPVWSPDGRRIAVYTGGRYKPTLGIYDVQTRLMTPIAGASGFFPSWTPDGRRVVFSAIGPYGQQRGRAMWVPIDGSSPPEPIPGTQGFGQSVIQALITPDGKHVIVRTERETTDSARALHTFVVSLRDGTVVPAIPEAPDPWRLSLSPDGKLVTYHVVKGIANTEVFVRHFHGGAGHVQISTDSGFAPRWSDDGRRIFYRTQSMQFRVATLDVKGQTTRLLRTDTVFADRSFAKIDYSFDVHPSGSRIVVTKDLGEGTRLRFVPNWRTVLRERISRN
jgi:DNA-binding SARP family transcriptional activator/Tol biopolymer transport system component